MTPFSIKKESFSSGDKINLVSRVGLLRVVTNRCVKLDHERTM
jgi:hypothetical protein